MTHDELVEKANFIFAAIKKRDDLLFSGRKCSELTENEIAELDDHCKDVRGVTFMEARGDGNIDCFVIANVLLRAINRQWDTEIAATSK